jgi:hypothetical protein
VGGVMGTMDWMFHDYRHKRKDGSRLGAWTAEALTSDSVIMSRGAEATQ